MFAKAFYEGVPVPASLREKHAALVAQVLYDLPDNLLLTETDTPRDARFKISELEALIAGQRKWQSTRRRVGAAVSIVFGDETVLRGGENGATHMLRVLLGVEPPDHYRREWYRHCCELIRANVPAYLVIYRSVNGDYFPANVRRVPLTPARHDYSRWMALIRGWAHG